MGECVQGLLLIVLNGIETIDLVQVMDDKVRLLIVLNGIETNSFSLMWSSLPTFNRTKWN